MRCWHLCRAHDHETREAVCVVQIAFLFGDDRCLTKATRMDPTDIDGLRRQREGLLRELSIAQKKGQQSPLINHLPWVDRDKPGEVRYFLQILSSNPNPIIASSAHRQLLMMKTRR